MDSNFDAVSHILIKISLIAIDKLSLDYCEIHRMNIKSFFFFFFLMEVVLGVVVVVACLGSF